MKEEKKADKKAEKKATKKNVTLNAEEVEQRKTPDGGTVTVSS